jgi:hypothetical protein
LAQRICIPIFAKSLATRARCCDIKDFLEFSNNSNKKLNFFILALSIIGGFGGLGVSVLAFGTQVRGFKPDRSRLIFNGEKILTMLSLEGK